jgi:hypothetical protein
MCSSCRRLGSANRDAVFIKNEKQKILFAPKARESPNQVAKLSYSGTGELVKIDLLLAKPPARSMSARPQRDTFRFKWRDFFLDTWRGEKKELGSSDHKTSISEWPGTTIRRVIGSRRDQKD